MLADTSRSPSPSATAVPDDADITAAANAVREHLAQLKATASELSRTQREVDTLRAVKDRFEQEAATAKAERNEAERAKGAALAERDAARQAEADARALLVPKDAQIQQLHDGLVAANTKLERYRAFLRTMTAELTPPASGS